MSLHTLARLTLTVAVLSGCSSSDRAGTDALVRDSAGVAILEMRREPFQVTNAWTISPEPRLGIGEEAGEPWEEFDRIVVARRTADGSLIVADGRSSELRVFDARGEFVRSIGREGGGPGEFRGIGWVDYVTPDTLIVIDPGHFRASMFTLAGDLVREVPIPSIGYPWPGAFRLPDGTFLFVWETVHNLRRAGLGEAAVGETSRSTMVPIRHAADGTVLDSLGTFAGREEAVFLSNGRLTSSYAAWGRMLVFALDGDRIFLGTQDRGEVRAYRPNGEVERIIRWPAGDLTLHQVHLDEFFEVAVGPVQDPVARERFLAEYRTRPVPGSLPAYGRLLIDSEGMLWISERYIPTTTPRLWAIVDPEAGAVATVEVPERFELYEAGPDYVLGRSTDDLGVQRVQLYGLQRR